MKKLLFILNLLLLTSAAAVAQPQLFFGAGVGPNFSKLRFTSFKNEYSKDFYVGKNYTSSYSTNIHGGLTLGVKLTEKFSVLTTPGFFLKNLNYQTESSTREIVRDIDDQNRPFYSYPALLEGNRTWSFKTRAVNIPIMARYNLVGDRAGLHLTGGISFNYMISGEYNTEFKEINSGILVKNNPIYPVVDEFDEIEGFIHYSEEFPEAGDDLRFGSADLDHFRANDVSLVLGAGTYFNLNDDGTVRLTLDWRFDFGQLNMYSPNREAYLQTGIRGTKPVRDIDNPNTNYDIVRTAVLVDGSQKIRSGILTIGVEFCPSCGF